MGKRAGRLFLLIEAVLLACILVLGATVAQAASDNRTPVTVTLTNETQADGMVLLKAKATKTGGAVVGNANVDFFVLANFFMESPVRIGSGTTDSTGTTSLTYQPTWTGRTTFSATFDGNSTLAPAEGKATLEVTSGADTYRSAPRDLAGLRRTTGRAVGTATLAVWLLLLAVLGRVVWTLKRPLPAQLPQPHTAPASTQSR